MSTKKINVMKYLSILFSLFILIGITNVNAQSTSSLNGNSYTFVLNDVNDESIEIIDKFTFSNNKVVSEKYSASKGYVCSDVVEKVDGNSSSFTVTLTHPTEGTVLFSGRVIDNSIYGEATINKNGNQSSLVFRGLTTQAWDAAMKKQKEANGQ